MAVRNEASGKWGPWLMIQAKAVYEKGALIDERLYTWQYSTLLITETPFRRKTAISGALSLLYVYLLILQAKDLSNSLFLSLQQQFWVKTKERIYDYETMTDNNISMTMSPGHPPPPSTVPLTPVLQ